MAKLSVELQRFFSEQETEQVKLADILRLAGESIFGFLFVLLSLPSALPVPAPGYSVPFGIVIFLLAIQLVAGRKFPWLPQKVLNHSISFKQGQKLVNAGVPWLQRIEAVTHPRLTSVCVSFPGRVIVGSAIALMAISMMIPIPLTNTLPAIGVFVTGFGLLEDDGAITLGGLFLCACGAALSTSVVIALFWGGSNLIELVKIWLS